MGNYISILIGFGLGWVICSAAAVFAHNHFEPEPEETKALRESYQAFCDSLSAQIGEAGHRDYDEDDTWCLVLEYEAGEKARVAFGEYLREVYLKSYPQGRYAAIARRTLRQMQARFAREAEQAGSPAVSHQWESAFETIKALEESYQSFCDNLSATQYPGDTITAFYDEQSWCVAIQTIHALRVKIRDKKAFFEEVVEPMLEGYLQLHPQGRHAAIARQTFRQIRERRAEQEAPSDYQGYKTGPSYYDDQSDPTERPKQAQTFDKDTKRRCLDPDKPCVFQ